MGQASSSCRHFTSLMWTHTVARTKNVLSTLSRNNEKWKTLHQAIRYLHSKPKRKRQTNKKKEKEKNDRKEDEAKTYIESHIDIKIEPKHMPVHSHQNISRFETHTIEMANKRTNQSIKHNGKSTNSGKMGNCYVLCDLCRTHACI